MKICGFSDFKMEAPGCHPGVTIYSAHFTLNEDVSSLFPYINAVAEDAVYFETPDTIQFKFNGRRCALYPKQLIVGGFEDRAHAIAFFNAVTGFLNDIGKRKAEIKPDPRRYKPVAVMDIFKLLPRSNCRECGQPTCLAFAAALSKGEILMERCPSLCDPEDKRVKDLEALFA